MTFRVAVSQSLFDSRGRPTFDPALLGILDEARDLLAWERLPANLTAITPEMTEAFDALYLALERVGEASFASDRPRTRLVARHGVGYDSVDVPAITRRGVLLTNTPVAVRRPVATMALTFILALAGKLMAKDRLTREGRWSTRTDHMGMGLTGRTLGIVGAGSIGRDVARVARPLDMRMIAADPYASAESIAADGLTLASLDEVMSSSDFVVVACLLTEETRRLIGAAELALMKPTAYLINVARGPIVDEAALIAALQASRIAGAALDVFEQEPVAPDNPLLAMANTIVTPHALAWTDESFDGIARDAMTSIVDTLSGRRPRYLVNPDALAARPLG